MTLARVKVHLRGRPPSATRAWDEAHRLGLAVLHRHAEAERCTVVVNANRREVLRWRIGRETHVSVHWALLPHVDDVLAVLDRDGHAWERLQAALPQGALPELAPVGDVHDLGVLLAAQRRLLEAPAPEVPVTWGRWPGRPPRRVLRLGSCETDPPLIRIHPVLDHASVPDWFVGFVLFHELLHVVHPPERRGRRRVVHPPQLLQAERRHPDHARAVAFEQAQVGEWMRRCRRRRTYVLG